MITGLLEGMVDMIKSDGNGGVQIRSIKIFMVLIVFILTIVTVTATAVTYSVTAQGDIDQNTQRIEACEQDVARLNENVREDFQNMKTDIREDLRHMEKNLKQYIDNYDCGGCK